MFAQHLKNIAQRKKISGFPLVLLLVAQIWAQPPERLAVPPSVVDAPWLESRRQAQLATVGQFEVYYDFDFVDQTAASGIDFRNRVVDDSGKAHKPVHYDHGNGLAVADVDGDGLLDLFFVTQVGGNQLWRNLGEGRFENITPAILALEDQISVSASFADIDNDGDPDLYITAVREGNRLFENMGGGHFKDISEESGLDYSGHSSSAVFFDYDRDGLLDMFLANVGIYTTDEFATGSDGEYRYYVGFTDAFSGHLKPERTEQSILFRNSGNNRFVDVSAAVRLTDTGWSGAASPLDANGDGWPDLYVLNMQGHDQYYENVQGEYFVDKSRQVFPRTPWGSMGIQVFDFDNDGRQDIYITDMHSDMSEDIDPAKEKLKSRMHHGEEFLQSGGGSIFGNAFFRGEGKGRFAEVSDRIGAENYWPWGLSSGDFNADGYEDVFITASMNYPYRYGVNSLLLNNRGRKFLDGEFILGIEPRRGGKTAMEPHETAAEAEVGARLGFTCHKLKARPWNIVETVKLIKAAAGPDYTVGIDPNQKFRLVHIAARLARELEPFGTVANFETPMLKSHLDWFRLLREKTHIPIALHANTTAEVLAALKAECIDYVNLSGSALEIKKAAAIAEAADVPCWVQLGGLCLGVKAAYSVHLQSTIPNATLPCDELPFIRVTDVLDEGLVLEEGHFVVPQKPGLGVTLDMGVVEKYRVG